MFTDRNLVGDSGDRSSSLCVVDASTIARGTVPPRFRLNNPLLQRPETDAAQDDPCRSCFQAGLPVADENLVPGTETGTCPEPGTARDGSGPRTPGHRVGTEAIARAKDGIPVVRRRLGLTKQTSSTGTTSVEALGTSPDG